MLFGWLVESGITSNSDIYVKDLATVGIGTGEQDRVGVAEIARDIQDWAAYHPPEMLPNGDIIIRKKPKSGEPETQEEPQAPAGPTDI